MQMQQSLLWKLPGVMRRPGPSNQLHASAQQNSFCSVCTAVSGGCKLPAGLSFWQKVVSVQHGFATSSEKKERRDELR